MASLTSEGLAGIRLLICMARADGVLKPDERYALEDALAGVALPDGLTIEKLLEEKNDPAGLAKLIQSSEGRDYSYASVYTLAHCDRHLDGAEQSILEALRREWGIKSEEDRALDNAIERGKIPEPAEGLHAEVLDEKAREAEFNALLRRYAILTSLTGAIPVPLVPDLLIVPMQMKMMYDIAALFGQKTNKQSIQLLFETLGVGTGARIGVTVLCKFVPGWGSVVGATSAFATTWALGKVGYTYFQSEGKASVESLKPMFRAEQKQGHAEFEKHKAAISEAQQSHAEKLKQLAYNLQQGKITQKQYEEQLDALP